MMYLFPKKINSFVKFTKNTVEKQTREPRPSPDIAATSVPSSNL